MKYLILILLFIVTSVEVSSALAGNEEKNYGSLKVAKVTSIYDADTFRVNIANVPAVIGDRMSIRVAGVDAAEMRGKCEQEKKLARAAKNFTVS